MKILLIEDDERECAKYKDMALGMQDAEIIAVTNSSKEAVKMVTKYKPDGIILDLELNNGEGSGLEFLQELNKLALKVIPKIVVITNIYSDTVYNFLHKNKVDFIFYKNQENYSQKNVLNTLLLLNEYKVTNNVSIKDIPNDEADKVDKIANLINNELDLIGVATHLKGRKYLFDAIYFIIENSENGEDISIVQYLVGKYKRASSTISRAMQNAILHAWRISSIDDLTELYTARINYETGVPTPTEFIYYYADKIRKLV